MEDEEVIEVLVGLGLSLLEAKIYLALLKIECRPATVKAVSNVAEVVRQDTYRVLSDLHKRGIVEKVLTTPVMYKCVPVESVISKLLKEKNEAYLNVKEKSEILLKNYQNIKAEDKVEENLYFSFTANTDLLIQKMKKESLNTKFEIEMIYPLEKMSVIAFHMLEDLKAALNRGVRVKLIMMAGVGVEFSKALRELRKTDAKYENLQMRYLKKRHEVDLTIFDSNRCFIRITDLLGDSLFSTNDNIVALASHYFNSVWEKAFIKPNSTS